MELKKFVSETLKEIIAGVKDAQEFAAKNDACINPNQFGTLVTPKNILDMGVLYLLFSLFSSMCVLHILKRNLED